MRLFIGFVGIHSLVLGAFMLFAPGLMLHAFGFPEETPVFFPSQTGVFLVLFGICYLFALGQPAFINAVFLTKASAVAFLVAHVTLFSAPRVMWAAAAGDGLMFVVLAVLAARTPRYRPAWLAVLAARARPR